MTHINKTTRFFSYILLFLVGFATAAFSDSFVDESTMKSLNAFQLGQSVSSMDTMAGPAAIGDSFINEATLAALKDFRFGYIDDTANTADSKREVKAASLTRTGDSFVKIEALNHYEQARGHLGECGYNC